MKHKRNPRTTADAQAIGMRVRARRMFAGMSQSALGEALRPPVSFQQVQKYERGANRISSGSLVQIAQILKCPVTELLEPQAIAVDGAPSLGELVSDQSAVKLLTAFTRVRDQRHRHLIAHLTEILAEREDRHGKAT